MVRNLIHLGVGQTKNPYVKTAIRIRDGIALRLKEKKFDSKVFCVGYLKTGTKSVGRAFEMLGYENCSFDRKIWRDYFANRKIVKLLEHAAKFESFDDLPWLKEEMIPILDFAFPDSKFVYLTRDEESWKNSFYHWRFKILGTYPDLDKAWQGYKEHEKFVTDYFRRRSSKYFITLDVKDPEGFKKLAAFLGKKTSQAAFPHRNKTFE